MDKYKWNLLKLKREAKKNGIPEFDLYLRDLTCTIISKYTEKNLQEIDIMDETKDFCKGDKQTLLRILGAVKGTLDMEVYLTDNQMAQLFESFPTVYSIMEFFYIEAGKRNKRYIPEIKHKGKETKIKEMKETNEINLKGLIKKEDKLESPYLF